MKKLVEMEDIVRIKDPFIDEHRNDTIAKRNADITISAKSDERIQQEAVNAMRLTLTEMCAALLEEIPNMSGDELTAGIQRISTTVQLLDGKPTSIHDNRNKSFKVDLTIDKMNEWIQSLPGKDHQ